MPRPADPSRDRRVAVEIAVQDAASARTARDAGADRVELCSALAATGGVTPSIGLVEAVVAVGLPVHVLIRPRPGGFVHDADERAVMLRDVRAALAAGAAGVVSGGLTEDGRVDQDLLARLVDATGDAVLTFHRAIDAVDDRLAALDALLDAGVGRVLTSGGAARAGDGVSALAELVARAEARLEIQAGGGVTVDAIPGLVRAGVDAIHLSARRRVAASRVGPGGGEAAHDVADGALVAAAVAAVRASTR
ncbi:copper homeostasis protein CutC [Clavibacter sp. VKM Ac-2873]|uniref:copper homeostasis protein CutC n=1 Tax=Clavibacter sp. VKM Ac-2873 TaxID=2783813 RepID=UPI00188BDBE5|nr:copper homeostasis protein CutC [Clavibacter sp. VKM Ac-2873]MBF4617899.1 copper homeostasis protein CutC [Clavibacter sp. VKM Ac-2873]